MSLAWVYLLIAGGFEIGWPVGLKIAQKPGFTVFGFILAGVAMSCSGFFLYMAQKYIPIGTAYAVWTGIGAAGTFLIGIWMFGDSSSLLKYLGVALIILGVITLKVG